MLVNGTPIKISKDLRQDDTFSLYLCWSWKLLFYFKALQRGSITGFKLGGKGGVKVKVPCLLFLQMIPCFLRLARRRQGTFDEYLFALSLPCIEDQFTKGDDFGRWVEGLERLASLLGYSIGGFPSIYIGLPLEAYFNSYYGIHVEDQFQKRLASWN